MGIQALHGRNRKYCDRCHSIRLHTVRQHRRQVMTMNQRLSVFIAQHLWLLDHADMFRLEGTWHFASRFACHSRWK